MKITLKHAARNFALGISLVSANLVLSNMALAQASKDPNYVKPSDLAYSCGTVKLAYSVAVAQAFLTRLRGVNVKPQTKAQVLSNEIALDNHPIIRKLVTEAVDRGYYDGSNGAGPGFTHQMEATFEGRCRNIVLDNNDKISIQHTGE